MKLRADGLGGAIMGTALLFGLVATASTPAVAQQKTAKQCTQEWRASKAANQANGITEKAYVAQCRGGAASAQQGGALTAQPAPAPTSTSPAATTRRATTGAAPAGSNAFASEAQAKSRCGSDNVVWVNRNSKVYHFSGSKAYGTTKQGAYMCERAAMAAGDRAAKNEKHP